MSAERIVLRGGPGHSRAYVIKQGQPNIDLMFTNFDWYSSLDIKSIRYNRTPEKDRWGKRIYRIVK